MQKANLIAKIQKLASEGTNEDLTDLDRVQILEEIETLTTEATANFIDSDEFQLRGEVARLKSLMLDHEKKTGEVFEVWNLAQDNLNDLLDRVPAAGRREMGVFLRVARVIKAIQPPVTLPPAYEKALALAEEYVSNILTRKDKVADSAIATVAPVLMQRVVSEEEAKEQAAEPEEKAAV